MEPRRPGRYFSAYRTWLTRRRATSSSEEPEPPSRCRTVAAGSYQTSNPSRRARRKKSVSSIEEEPLVPLPDRIPRRAVDEHGCAGRRVDPARRGVGALRADGLRQPLGTGQPAAADQGVGEGADAPGSRRSETVSAPTASRMRGTTMPAPLTRIRRSRAAMHPARGPGRDSARGSRATHRMGHRHIQHRRVAEVATRLDDDFVACGPRDVRGAVGRRVVGHDDPHAPASRLRAQ